MLLCVEYMPNINITEDKKTVSHSKMIVCTPLGNNKMAKVNTLDGDQADVLYGLMVGLNDEGDVKDIEEETKNLEKENIE